MRLLDAWESQHELSRTGANVERVLHTSAVANDEAFSIPMHPQCFPNGSKAVMISRSSSTPSRLRALRETYEPSIGTSKRSSRGLLRFPLLASWIASRFKRPSGFLFALLMN